MNQRRLAVSAVCALLVGCALWAGLRRLDRPVPAAPRTTAAQRIVSLSPALTEILFALGAGDRVVGITDFCAYPPAVERLPRCGGFLNPNLEAITATEPDLIVLQGLHDLVRDYCEANSLAYSAHQLDTLADLRGTIRALGDELDLAAAADALVNRMDGEFERIRAAVAGEPEVAVFVCTGRADGPVDVLNTCGGGTFLGELVALAGGRNLFADSPELYPQPSLEALTERAPEVILDLRPGQELTADQRRRVVDEWRALASLPAVRNGRVEVLCQDHLMLPSPRAVDTVRAVAEVLHPGARLPPPAAPREW